MKPKTLARSRKNCAANHFLSSFGIDEEGIQHVWGVQSQSSPSEGFLGGKYPSYEPVRLVITPAFSLILRFWPSFKAPMSARQRDNTDSTINTRICVRPQADRVVTCKNTTTELFVEHGQLGSPSRLDASFVYDKTFQLKTLGSHLLTT